MTKSQDKIAIITGGTRDLGRSTVLSLAKRGIDSIFTYQSNQSEAEKVTELVADSGRRAIALQLDTGNVKTFDSFVTSVRQALAKLGTERFDYLINNAGTSLHKNLSDNRGRIGCDLQCPLQGGVFSDPKIVAVDQ